jgi:penicillin G amidase
MRARFIRRGAKWLAGILIALPVLAIASSYVWWTRSLPEKSGSIPLAGLSGEARVVRDRYGVPHIFANSTNDAVRVLGYVHAQDRLFQMEMTRRVSQGRLAAVIGTDGLRYDRLFRTLDLAGHARNSLSALSPEARVGLDAYAEGVNQWLAEGHALPIEYTLLGFAPEPWRPEDSLLWGKAMAWKLSANWRQDALRAKLATRYDRSRLERLFPKPFPEWPVSIEPRLAASASRADAGTAAPPSAVPEELAKSAAVDFAQMLAIPTIGHGASNEWVVDGSRSATGKPLLANDPHLELTAPIIWYLARITTPELTLTGATAPGAPVIMLGQNRHIAWGFTTTESDTQDLFIETLDPNKPGHYLTPEGPKPLITQQVDIEVKGSPKVSFPRRMTHHGPIISDIMGEMASDGELVSLAWTGFSDTDTTAEALFRINQARNTQDFLAALRLYQAPTQNLAFAATEGTIGFVAAGSVPLRKSGDGRYPAKGETGAGEWTGVVPFEGWPQLINPQAGAIVNANNMVTSLSYPYWLGYDQGPGFRAQRIVELLGQRQKHDLASFSAIQMDVQAIHARDLVPFLLKAPADTPLAAQALDLMREWDFRAIHDRPEPLILDWWLRRMNAHLLRSGLDAVATSVGGLNAAAVIDVLRRPDGFCNGDAGNDCTGAIKAALSDTLAELSSRYGNDPSQWRWGDEHRAMIANQVMDRVPGFKRLFSLDFPSDGSFYSVNRGGNPGGSDAEHPLARTSGAGYRGIYDLADPSRSRFIITTGQSAHPLSPHYADQLPLWRRGEGIRLDVSEAELMADNSEVMTFRPAISAR